MTYSHIKDTAGIRDGMDIHLLIFTGAGDVRPVQGGFNVQFDSALTLKLHFILEQDECIKLPQTML